MPSLVIVIVWTPVVIEVSKQNFPWQEVDLNVVVEISFPPSGILEIFEISVETNDDVVYMVLECVTMFVLEHPSAELDDSAEQLEDLFEIIWRIFEIREPISSTDSLEEQVVEEIIFPANELISFKMLVDESVPSRSFRRLLRRGQTSETAKFEDDSTWDIALFISELNDLKTSLHDTKFSMTASTKS